MAGIDTSDVVDLQWERIVITEILEDKDVEEIFDANHDDIRNVASAFFEGHHDGLWIQKLLHIMNTCHKGMNSASSSLQLNTLRKVYTDVAVLRGLLQSRSSCLMDAIATLDQAIIIAGPYGLGRQELILDLIHRIQHSAFCDLPSPPHNVRRSPRIVVSSLRCTIPCPPIPPSFFTFQSSCSRRPFVLRNYAVDWPACSSRPWGSYAYLRSVAGPGRVVPVEIGGDYRSDDWQQKLIPWDDFLSFLEFEDHPASANNAIVYYMAQHDLTRQFPKLLEDVVIPDYLYAELVSPDFPSYRPLHNENKMLLSMWLGPKGTLSPAHIDPYFNFYVQITGYKSVWLAPPSVSGSMHALARDEQPASSMLSNTSRVNVFCDPQELQEFPDFIKDVTPLAMTVTLGPGDALFFPPGWWHSMRSESTSFSLSMWF